MSVAMNPQESHPRDAFWETDLAEVERQMIGDKADLSKMQPYFLEGLVPHQGSVLLQRSSWILVPVPAWHKRAIVKIRQFIGI